MANPFEENIPVGAHFKDITFKLLLLGSAAGFYFFCALLFLIPLHFNIMQEIIARQIPDASQAMWFYAWWPYAIAHHLNPFFTSQVWAPVGQSLVWTESTPIISILLSPVTLMFGPMVSYNVAVIFALTLNSFFAFLLCREASGKFLPAIAGGWIFGFSPYVMAELMGRPNLYCVWPIPLLALLAIRYMKGKESQRSLVLWSITAEILLFFTSLELFATTALAVCLAIAISFFFHRRADRVLRSRLYRLFGGVVISTAVTVMLISPILWMMLVGKNRQFGPVHPASDFSADIANFLIPTRTTWVGGDTLIRYSSHFSGFLPEQSAYIGLPTMVLLGLYIFEFWKAPASRFLMTMLVGFVLLSLGPYLTVAGINFPLALPWGIIEHVPLLEKALPARLSLYVSLTLAVIIAYWLANSHRALSLRTALGCLVVVSLFPNVFSGLWDAHPENPTFFTQRLYQKYFKPDENLVALPYGINGCSMLWQAETGFYFRLSGGYLSLGGPYARQPIPEAFYSGVRPAHYRKKLAAFAKRYHVSAIIVPDADRGQFNSLLAPLSRHQRHVGGVWIYPISHHIFPQRTVKQ